MTRAPRPAVGRQARQNKQEGMMHMTQAAREYGTALYELCAAEGLETQVLEQLQALKTLLTQYPAWYKVLACPTIPAQERDEAAEQALRGRVHPYVLNFVRLLIDHGRAEELEGCAEVYGVLYDEAHGILPVCAVTAVPLTPAQSDRLTRRLQDASGKTIRLKNRMDPACMGGVRLELAGRSIDGSVRAQLESLRRQLMADLA